MRRGAAVKKPRRPNLISARVIELRHEQFAAGEDWALLDAIDLCIRSGQPVPVWAANAFGKRYLDWRCFRATTLDAAFKVEREGQRLVRRAQREQLKPRVVLEVIRLRRDKNLPLDVRLFERVGGKLGISAGRARAIYYDKENPWRELFAAMPPKEILAIWPDSWKYPPPKPR